MIVKDVLKCWSTDCGVPSVTHSLIEVMLMLYVDNLVSLHPVMCTLIPNLVVPALSHLSRSAQSTVQDKKHNLVIAMEHQISLLLQAAVLIVMILALGVMVRGVTI